MQSEGRAGFGGLLRALRRAGDLTQTELARRVGCTTDTIKKIESGRRRPSRDLADLLARALAVDAGEREAFLAAARAQAELPPAPTLPAPRLIGAPAHLVPLIGRAWELANLRALVTHDGARIVTLVGPGGIGKTRMAIAVAQAIADRFRDGAIFVGLAGVSDTGQIAPALAQALGLREMRGTAIETQLCDYLAPRRLLLVLDNCEHLPAAALLVGRLIAAAPDLVVLSTSRAALRIAGEQEFPLGPLPLPARGQPSPEQAAQYAAIELFVARARAIQPNFALSDESAPLAAAICRQLDGLPLAIELAAARLRLLSLPDLHQRLRSPLGVLTGGPRDAPARQRTLAATIDWSFQLLAPAERRCFLRMAVFADGCALAVAEAVCADDAAGMARSVHGSPAPPPLDSLSALVDQSLIQRVELPTGETRLMMLETIRAFALERLEASDDHRAARDAHARAYLDLAAAALPQIVGPAQVEWLDRLAAERGNLQAALSWWRDSDPARALGLAATLWPFWDLCGRLSEGRAWLDALLSLAPDAPPEVRARALHGAGHFASFQGDYDRADECLAASMALYTGLGRQARVAHVRCAIGLLAWFRGDHPRAEAELESSARLARAAGATWETADALHYLGHVVFDRGDSARAETVFRESLALFRRTGDQRNIALPLKDLGLIASQRGDYAAARPLYDESLAASRAFEDVWHIADTLLRLGDLARLHGAYDEAQACYLESLDGWRRAGARGGVAEALNLLGQLALGQRKIARAREYFGEALALHGEGASPRVLAGLRYSLGRVAWLAGDRAAAEAAYRASLELNAQEGYRPGIGDCLVGLAEIAAAAGHPARAARLLGASETHREQPRGFMPLADSAGVARTSAAIAALVPPEQAAAHCAAGRALSLEAALALAREPAAAPRQPPAPASALARAGLTAREIEVLMLVVEGLTDQQVADALVISIRTVQSHLRTIYSKLGCPTRTAAARIASQLLA